MAKTDPAAPAEVLAAELSAALPARKAALEFERRFAAPDQNERINRGLFEIRIAESRLKPTTPEALPAAATLATLAVAEAEDLEAEALVLEPLVGPGAAGRQVGLLRVVCALFRLARLGEGRARACFTYARQRKRLPGFDDALELAPENELFFLALRRFETLLKAGGAWSAQDADWLRLRAVTAPGRLRLRAAALRSGAETAAQWSLPPGLEAKRQPFVDFGYESTTALAWAVAGFTPKEALAWGDVGLAMADQAQAWRDRGLSPEEAAAWANADLLPDEAAAFKACGAMEPSTARDLRHVLGDVEHLLVWHRAGFEMAEVLRLRASGVNDVEVALTQRKAKPKPPRILEPAPMAEPPMIIRDRPTPAPAPVEAPAPILPAAAVGAAAPPPLVPIAETQPKALPALPVVERSAAAPPALPPLPVEAELEPSPALELPTDAPAPEDWAQARALQLFGVETADQGEALAQAPEKGGAWMAWGVVESSATVPVATGEAMSVPIAGLWMDLIADSELVALPSFSQAPKRLEAKEQWQARLDGLRASQGRPAAVGQWHLHGWEPSRAWLFWGLVFKRVPWGQALDFDSHETWAQRWARKSDEWGEKDAVCPCLIGRTPDGGWWMGIVASVVGSEGSGLSPIKPTMMLPAWRKSLGDFCVKMGMGAHAAQWHLLAGAPAEPERSAEPAPTPRSKA